MSKIIVYKDMRVGHGELHTLLTERDKAEGKKRQEIQVQIDKLVARLDADFYKHVPRDFFERLNLPCTTANDAS